NDRIVLPVLIDLVGLFNGTTLGIFYKKCIFSTFQLFVISTGATIGPFIGVGSCSSTYLGTYFPILATIGFVGDLYVHSQFVGLVDRDCTFHAPSCLISDIYGIVSGT